MSNVVPLHVQTTLDVPAQKVLTGALDASLSEVVVIGIRETGGSFFATSSGSRPEILWLLECAKHDLLEGARDGA